MAERRPRSMTTKLFLALVLGSSGWALSRAVRPPPGASQPASSSVSAGASGSAGELFPADARVVDPAVRPLLGGLALGDELSPGVRVVGMRLRDGRIEVALQRGEEVGLVLSVERKRPGRRAAHESANFGVSYGDVHPLGAPAPDGNTLARALRDRIAANEAKVAAPPGL